MYVDAPLIVLVFVSRPPHCQGLRAAKIGFLVAPYEADAQLAFLCRNGHVSAVITEDADLLPYGCPLVRYVHMDSVADPYPQRFPADHLQVWTGWNGETHLFVTA